MAYCGQLASKGEAERSLETATPKAMSLVEGRLWQKFQTTHRRVSAILPRFLLTAIHSHSYFRRSRLFFREAAFFSGGEGCEWRAQRATVSREWGYNGENLFSALSPFAGSRKGFSPHIPASRLFVHFHTTMPTSPPNPSTRLNLFNLLGLLGL